MTPRRRALWVFVMLGGLGGVAIARNENARGRVAWLWQRVSGRATVAERVAEYRDDVAERLGPKFTVAGLPFPPADVTLLAFKDTRRVEVHGRAAPNEPWKFVTAYPVLGASGELGPKLREGDQQVPEGVYPLESLNPNSRFHLALRVGYPNTFDRAQAAADGRTGLGGDIMVHGGTASIGCLAMGDAAIEELFVLAALAGPKRVTLVLSPTDFRVPSDTPLPQSPPWVAGLYDDLRRTLSAFPRRGS